jgi:hypothetical protein
MGLLLKIILFGVAVYALWRTVAHWKGLFDRVVGKPQPPARPQPPPSPPQQQQQQQPSARAQVIDASASCPVCNAYLSNAATKCARPDCPLPEARRA